MKKTVIALAALLSLATGKAVSQQAFKVYPHYPIAGDSITLHYNPDSTILKGLAPVTGVVYIYRNNDWETYDLPMQMTDSGWAGGYHLPKDAALFVANFSANGKTDKGGKVTYTNLTTARTGGQIPTGYASWAFLRTKALRNAAPPAIDDVAVITDDVGFFWMNNELKYFPQSRRHIFYNAMVILKSHDAARMDSIMPREIKFISNLPDVTEAELMDVSKAYRNLAGNRAKADSMDKVIIAKFPDGLTARDKDLQAVYLGKAEDRDVRWKAFVAKYPLAKFRDADTDVQRLWYEKAFRAIVYQAVMKRDYAVMDNMIPDASFISLSEFHRLLVMGEWSHNTVTTEFIFPYSKKLVEAIELRSKQKWGADSKFYSPLQWEQYILNMAVPAYLGHATLLHKMGDDKTALVWMEKVNTQARSKDAEFMGLYATLLENNGRHADAMQVVENAVAANKATPEAIALLKKEYVKKNKSDKGFDEYFNSLKSAETLSAQQAHLREQLIRKNAPTFKLEQLKGGYADLAKLKGHVVVLDFWATWCGPCKAALPGMQMAVNKYAKDDKVDFFFIATQETKPNYRDEIKKFLKENNYNLNVLYDGKNDKNGHLDEAYSKYAKELRFSGIPAKIIIDRKGMVRWSSNGYMGSPSALADEISYIIELLKKEG
ncbi:TlpA disulfide reductase family protein [uncultured Chitinophaga sp.]|uniref:TlpA disulfide reductase family protein n=1 Tax=uncultured Chitinophaga sp. TaxID=339340 RepID=UPI0025F33176|nr:TlpA disulfide reductase family protein [uncultured Chitinophaga sp.]